MNNEYSSKKLTINTSGDNGRSGSDGRDGTSAGFGYGDDGSNGEHGSDGKHAKDIYIDLSADESAQAVSVKTQKEACALTLGDEDVTIFTNTRGGAGGDGGSGGDGSHGR